MSLEDKKGPQAFGKATNNDDGQKQGQTGTVQQPRTYRDGPYTGNPWTRVNYPVTVGVQIKPPPSRG